jgi:hypothetical protein
MALNVENGTGLADAESYISVSEFKSFCKGRGYTAAEDFETEDVESKLRDATSYIDTIFRYKGARSKVEQSLEFPRVDCLDWSSLPVLGVPRRVKQACAELAYKAFSETLYQDQDRGGKVISESVGPISVTYAEDAPTGKVWQLAHNLLQPFVRDKTLRRGPQWTAPTPDSTYFNTGMHDNPSLGSTNTDALLGGA